MSIFEARARLAAHKRHHPDADHTALERDLAAARVEEAARRVAADLPPLTSEQRARIGALLAPVLVSTAEAADDAV